MTFPTCYMKLVLANLFFGNLVVIAFYAEGDFKTFGGLYGVVSILTYSAVAMASFYYLWRRIKAMTHWSVLIFYGVAISFAIPTIAAFLWGMDSVFVEYIQIGHSTKNFIVGGLIWSFFSVIVSVYLTPPFMALNILGFFLHRRALRKEHTNTLAQNYPATIQT